MAKEAIFKFQGNVVKSSLIKVDRNKVYGWSEEIYTDKSGNICTWATLLMYRTFENLIMPKKRAVLDI